MKKGGMLVDPIVEEIRLVREEHAARFDYDIHRICEDIRKHERTSRLKFVKPSRRVAAESSKKYGLSSGASVHEQG